MFLYFLLYTRYAMTAVIGTFGAISIALPVSLYVPGVRVLKKNALPVLLVRRSAFFVPLAEDYAGHGNVECRG